MTDSLVLYGAALDRAMEDDPTYQCMQAVARSTREGMWSFPCIGDWRACFTSLDDALPLVALMEAGQRYLWWVSGDIAEALMQEFGRTAAVKASIGAIFGCKIRAVEYRAKAAVVFSPDMRYPDVPTELYRESLRWGGEAEAIGVLEQALADGMNSSDLRNERMLEQGHVHGPPIWNMQRGTMSWHERNGETTYTVRFTEEGGTRFAKNAMPVVITIAPLLE